MEYIDVLTPKGKLTGEKRTKDQIHTNGSWHRTVHVWIINSNNEILMQRRAKTVKNYPNMWDISVGGHISAGEDSLTTALRETEEEIGIKISQSDLEYIGELTLEIIINKGEYIDNEYNDIYIVRKDIDLTEMKKQDEDVDVLEYVSLAKLRSWIDNKNPELISRDDEFNLLFNSI